MKPSAVSMAVLIACMLTLLGCPKQGDGASDSGSQEPAAPTPTATGTTPSFIKALCAATASQFTVTDEGAAVVYEKLRFFDDGNFEAATTIRLGDEPFECTERGTWSLEGNAAESKSSAAIVFEMTETNCAGREAPFSFRTRAILTGGDAQLSHI